MAFSYQRRYRGPLQALILDWAGTTVDYGSCAPALVFRGLFADEGVTIDDAQARAPMGLAKKDHLRAILQDEAVGRLWAQVHRRVWSEADVERMYQEFVPRQTSVLAEHSSLIPGVVEAVDAFREAGLKIGSSTGYTRAMMEVVAPEAAKQGYRPDTLVCDDEVPAGRPAPWLAFRNLERLGIYPPEAAVKIGDTRADMAEGLNGGLWTIGLAATGNEMGLSLEATQALPEDVLRSRLERARTRLAEAGAHEVVDSWTDIGSAVARITERLSRGERP